MVVISDTANKTYELTDTQGSPDAREIAINKVGIKDLRLPLVISDRKHGKQSVTAMLDVGVDLLGNQRGAHMSRFIELIEEFRVETFNINSIPDFLHRMTERLESNNAYVNIDFDYFMEKESPLSKKKALLDYDCGFGGFIRNGEVTNWIITRVPITTLCPCSKKNSHQGAHNQRAIVSGKVVISDLVWLEELIEMIESEGSSQLYPILKRDDEAYVTDEAYDNPKFVEDIVRNLSASIESDSRMHDYSLECVSYESIHNHNAYARVVRGELWNNYPFE